MTYQAVIFDMGGTIEKIWHTPELRMQATPDLQRILKSAGIDLPLSLEELYEVVTQGWNRYHTWAIQTTIELSPEQVWNDYIFADIPVDRQILNEISQELSFFLETRYFHREMRSEVPTVLELLHNMGLKIGLISNVNSKNQVPFNLDVYHIRNFFDPIVLSSEFGRRKPDPAIFHHAAWQIKAPTSRCVYVGDRIARDIAGAKKAGFGLAIHIHHSFQHGEGDTGPQPDYCIHNLTELVDIFNPSTQFSTQTQPHFPTKVRALLFDAGDILYYRLDRGARFRSFLKEISLDTTSIPPEEKEDLTQKAYQGLIDRDQYHTAILKLYGIQDPVWIEKGRQVLLEEENNIHFFDGVRDTLHELKQRGYLLGIITDTANPTSVKLSWFEKGGFGHVWDAIISSMEIGSRKPDPRMYHAALEQLGMHIDQAVFVGHKASELEGARAVGLKTIAFNYDQDAKADYYIRKFSDLLSLSLIA